MQNGNQNFQSHEPALTNGRRSIEATPQSGRRHPLQSPEYSDHVGPRQGVRSHGQAHSRSVLIELSVVVVIGLLLISYANATAKNGSWKRLLLLFFIGLANTRNFELR